MTVQRVLGDHVEVHLWPESAQSSVLPCLLTCAPAVPRGLAPPALAQQSGRRGRWDRVHRGRSRRFHAATRAGAGTIVR